MVDKWMDGWRDGRMDGGMEGGRGGLGAHERTRMFRYVLHGWGSGRLWNVSGDCGMCREILDCYGRWRNVTVED